MPDKDVQQTVTRVEAEKNKELFIITGCDSNYKLHYSSGAAGESGDFQIWMGLELV